MRRLKIDSVGNEYYTYGDEVAIETIVINTDDIKVEPQTVVVEEKGNEVPAVGDDEKALRVFEDNGGPPVRLVSSGPIEFTSAGGG